VTAAFLPADEVDNFINIRIVRLATKLQRLTLRRLLRDAGLPVLEWRILFALARSGPNHLRSITSYGALDPAHASRAAAQLEAKGLISRKEDPADHRRRVLSLTPDGERIVREIWPATMDFAAEMRAGFSVEEFDTLKSLLDRALSNADALLEEEPQKSRHVPAA